MTLIEKMRATLRLCFESPLAMRTDHAQFHWRRIPGTLTLSITNLIAAGLLIFPETFETAPVNSYVAALAPGWAFGWAFFAAGFFLALSTVTRRWTHLNIGSGVSLFIWTFQTAGIVVAAVQGAVALSPIAYALLFWMSFGQATMLFVPLWARGRGTE